jgi:predicted transcriptional regulator
MTVRIPEPLSRELKKLSRSKQQPVSDLVRDSLRRYVALEQLRSIRARLRPYAEKAGILTDEDVFRMNS